MSTDYHVAVDAVVEACKGVALLGKKEDPSANYDMLEAQFSFVEKYCARLFKINAEPFAWLSVSDRGDGVDVSISMDHAVWGCISDRTYAEFSATKKDNRRKNLSGENPDYGVAFDKWWEIVSNICQKAEGDTRARMLGSIGFMVALQQTGKCNYRKGCKVSRTTMEKMARSSSIHLGGGSPIGASDIARTIEIFLKNVAVHLLWRQVNEKMLLYRQIVRHLSQPHRIDHLHRPGQPQLLLLGQSLRENSGSLPRLRRIPNVLSLERNGGHRHRHG